MSLELLKDYVVYHNANFFDKLQPMKLIKAHILATKKYVFVFPQESHGVYIFVEVRSTYDIFDGTPTHEVLEKLITNSQTVDDLEAAVKKLLDNNEKYVHRLSDKKICNFRGFLGKYTLTMSYKDNAHVGVLVNGKSKQFKNFLNM
jgi:hypothetical protein